MEIIHVVVATSNGVFEADVAKSTKIQEVIDQAVADRMLEQGDGFELFHDGDSLQPVSRPLVSFGLEESVNLQLVATGSGV